MPLNVWQNPEQRTGFILAIFFTPLCILATILRFIATKRFRRAIGWDDWFALLALLTYLPYIGYTLWLFGTINGRDPVPFFLANTVLYREVLRVGNTMNGIYALQQTFVKFSLLALYHRLFWVNRHFVRSVWLVGIVQGCWGIAILLVHIFLCTPMEKIWTPWMVEGTCVDVNTLFAIYEALNSVLDFIVAGLAIWMLPSLQIRKSTRWHLAGLFVLGAFSGFIGIIKIVEAYDSAQRNFQAVIWNVVQMSISIICCCAPIYRSILPKMGMSSIPSWASWSLRGSSRRSKAVASTADGTSKFSMRSYQGEGKAGGTSVSGNWINLDGSSQRALAWVDAESHGKDQSTYQDIPMGRMKVERSVEVI